MNAAIPASLVLPSTPCTLRSSAKLGWKGFGADLLAFPAGTYQVPSNTTHRIGFHVGAPVKTRCRCDDTRSSRIQAHGDADVIPAGLDGEWVDESDNTVLRIWMTDEFTRAALDQLGLSESRTRIRPQFQLRDPRLQHLAWALRAELESDLPSAPLYAESLCTAMMVRLVQGLPTPGRRRQTLGPRASRRVAEFIDSHLDQRLTLSELAAIVELSVPHFKVLFRETFGMPVHRYVLERRVERARDLLLQGKLSATQVALETGFSHQSHMAHWMGRLLGATPRQIIRSAAQHDDEAVPHLHLRRD